MTARTDVVDVPARSRYEVRRDGELVGHLDYEATGRHRVLTHTVVDPAHGGQGVATTLVREVLADVRARGLTITPECSFVAHRLRVHPEDRDLVADRPGQPPGPLGSRA